MVSTFLSLVGALLVFENRPPSFGHRRHSGSYMLIPPNQVSPHRRRRGIDASPRCRAFALGLQAGRALLVFGPLIYAILGVLSRLMPQLQIFFLAMPINILAGFVLLMMFIGVMMTAFLDFFAAQMRLLGG